MRNVRLLRNHEKIHKENPRVKCEKCDHTYKDNSSLNGAHKNGCPTKKLYAYLTYVKIYDN